jgi:hypothetical protein
LCNSHIVQLNKPLCLGNFLADQHGTLSTI